MRQSIARAQYLKTASERLLSIDREQLATSDRLNHDLYRDLIETAIAGLAFHNDAVPIRGVASSQPADAGQSARRRAAERPARDRHDADGGCRRTTRTSCRACEASGRSSIRRSR